MNLHWRHAGPVRSVVPVCGADPAVGPTSGGAGRSFLPSEGGVTGPASTLVTGRRRRRLILAQGLDAATFVAFYTLAGPALHQERNPLILGLMAIGGVNAIAVVKVGLALWVTRARAAGQSRFASVRAFNRRFPSFHRRSFVVALNAAVASGVVGAGFNLAAILHTAVAR